MKYVLASASARRQQFLKDLAIDFEVRLSSCEESYPSELQGAAIPMYIAQQKAAPLLASLQEDEILISADTLIWFEGEAIGKPKDYADAFQTLSRFSERTHQVITAVCLSTTRQQICFHDTTLVTFATLTPEMIDYYLTHYQPYDKAGSYGIQEWIGYRAIRRIEGSFYTVMGLPVHLVGQYLRAF